MAESSGTDLEEFLLHFAGKAADGAVVEPVGDGTLLGFLQAIDGALLLGKIAGIFDFGFDGFEVVAFAGRQNGVVGGWWLVVGKAVVGRRWLVLGNST